MAASVVLLVPSIRQTNLSSLLELISANLVLHVRRKNLQSVTKHLTINEETLRDRGHGLVPSPNVNFGYLFPTSDYTALAICPLPLMLLPFICSVINKL